MCTRVKDSALVYSAVSWAVLRVVYKNASTFQLLSYSSCMLLAFCAEGFALQCYSVVGQRIMVVCTTERLMFIARAQLLCVCVVMPLVHVVIGSAG